MLTTEKFSMPIGEPRRWNSKGCLHGWTVECFWCHEPWAEINIVVKDEDTTRVLPQTGKSFRDCPECGTASVLEELERSSFLVKGLWPKDILPANADLLQWEIDAVKRNQENDVL